MGFFSNNNFYREFHQHSLSDEYPVVSVDVFDTLLFRETKPEYARFLEISEKIHKELAKKGVDLIAQPIDLFHQRNYCARAAYRNTSSRYGVREASYEEIIDVWLSLNALPVEYMQTFRAVELEYESTVLRPNSHLVEILQKATENGKRVICISDMYFSASDINSLINKVIPDLKIHKVYSSSEAGFGKSSGYLYKEVADCENVEPENIVHCGDNYWSDVVMARKSGVMGVYVPRELLWRLGHRFRSRMFNLKHCVR